MFGAFVRQSFDCVILNARESRWLIEVSDSFCELTGYRREELLGRTSVEVGLVSDDEARGDAISRADAGLDGLYDGLVRRKDGEERLVEFSHKLLGDRFVLTILRDVTQRREHEAHLQQMAQTDPLTGLLNVRAFHDEVERQLRICVRRGVSVSLLLVDLDGLKEINDEYGHQSGDVALCAVADGLRRATRESDVIGRIGGDEFSVLLTRSGEPGAERVVDDLNQGLSVTQNFTGSRWIPISVSAGIASFPDCPPLYESLLREADRAMYEVKR